tara:strand:+ start:26 stop:325 length:300 start_codon:yes stop_codon:yes gene_type:complete
VSLYLLVLQSGKLQMKIKLGLRGSSDAINHIIIKMDDLTLITSDNLFLIGEENRNKMGENIIKLLDALSVDNEIEIRDTLQPEIERELNMTKGALSKYG